MAIRSSTRKPWMARYSRQCAGASSKPTRKPRETEKRWAELSAGIQTTSHACWRNSAWVISRMRRKGKDVMRPRLGRRIDDSLAYTDYSLFVSRQPILARGHPSTDGDVVVGR